MRKPTHTHLLKFWKRTSPPSLPQGGKSYIAIFLIIHTTNYSFMFVGACTARPETHELNNMVQGGFSRRTALFSEKWSKLANFDPPWGYPPGGVKNGLFSRFKSIFMHQIRGGGQV